MRSVGRFHVQPLLHVNSVAEFRGLKIAARVISQNRLRIGFLIAEGVDCASAARTNAGR